jgi:rRNA maturation endonuclease Nob1
MAKFKIEVTIVAKCSYEVEVEASDESKAEDIATGLWREELPDDFQVAKGYITDWEIEDTEQLTAVCERCDVEYPLLDWPDDSDFCTPCGAKILEEEKAKIATRD